MRALADVRKSWLQAGGLHCLEKPIDRAADLVDFHDHQARPFEKRWIAVEQVMFRALDVDLENVDRAVRDVVQKVDVGNLRTAFDAHC